MNVYQEQETLVFSHLDFNALSRFGPAHMRLHSSWVFSSASRQGTTERWNHFFFSMLSLVHSTFKTSWLVVDYEILFFLGPAIVQVCIFLTLSLLPAQSCKGKAPWFSGMGDAGALPLDQQPEERLQRRASLVETFFGSICLEYNMA